jgi:hypothetical protein
MSYSWIRFAIFLSVVSALSLLLHGYLWVRLVRDPGWTGPWRNLATVGLWSLAALIPLGAVAWRLVPGRVTTVLSWTGYLWMGAMLYLLLPLWLTEPLRLGHTIAGWLGRPVAPDRRLFFARTVAASLGLLAPVVSGIGVATALRRVRVKPVEVRLTRLPASLSGFSLVQLTDVHVGPTIGGGFVDELVETANGLAADAIVITGDLVDGSVAELGPMVARLGKLRARHGVYFVTGNHEYYSGARPWVEFLGSIGIRVLRNEHVTLAHPDGIERGALHLAGIDDWSAGQFPDGHGPDLPGALAGRHSDYPVVLLAHQPRAVRQASEHRVDLQLSGHTHGGQLFPFNLLARLQQPFVAGLHRLGPTQIYVSSGTGYWGPPMRVGTTAEITHIRLIAES